MMNLKNPFSSSLINTRKIPAASLTSDQRIQKQEVVSPLRH